MGLSGRARRRSTGRRRAYALASASISPAWSAAATRRRASSPADLVQPGPASIRPDPRALGRAHRSRHPIDGQDIVRKTPAAPVGFPPTPGWATWTGPDTTPMTAPGCPGALASRGNARPGPTPGTSPRRMPRHGSRPSGQRLLAARPFPDRFNTGAPYVAPPPSAGAPAVHHRAPVRAASWTNWRRRDTRQVGAMDHGGPGWGMFCRTAARVDCGARRSDCTHLADTAPQVHRVEGPWSDPGPEAPA